MCHGPPRNSPSSAPGPPVPEATLASGTKLHLLHRLQDLTPSLTLLSSVLCLLFSSDFHDQFYECPSIYLSL